MSPQQKQVSDPLAEIRNLPEIECGAEAAKHFAFAEGYTNLNHGSYGTFPIEVRSVFRHFQDRMEARPDAFVRYEYRTHLLNEAREAIAKYMNVPVENCVLTCNATTAFDTVIHNLVIRPGDVFIVFADAYDSFEHTIRFITETTPAEYVKIRYTHPLSDDQLCNLFESTIKDIRAQGKNPRLASFDTISSLPAVRMPFERLTELCRLHGVLSCIDGAHSVGQFPLDLQHLNADFFTSNLHKWLHVPRGCALFYVPERNQHILRATLPTGFGFIPLDSPPASTPDSAAFAANFASVGTLDDTPYLCISAALAWREKLTWKEKKGEEAIMAYTQDLARKGGKRVADILQTNILDNDEGTLSNSSLVNVRLPLTIVPDEQMKSALVGSDAVTAWIRKTMILEHGTAVSGFLYAGCWWTRLSAQVYLTINDFEHAGLLLKEVCQRANNGEWKH